jgi:hypothetical protein
LIGVVDGAMIEARFLRGASFMGIRWLNVSALIGVFALTAPCAAPLVLADDSTAQGATAPPTPAKPAKPAKSGKPKRVCTLTPGGGGTAIPRRNCHTEYPPDEEQQAEASEPPAAPTANNSDPRETMDTVSTEEGESAGGG